MSAIMVTPEQMAWMFSDDTGISSKAIWRVMTGTPKPKDDWWGNHPHDPDDFGRCYRLLHRFPEWRESLWRMEAESAEWAALVARWDELTAIYESEVGVGIPTRRLFKSAPKLYALMREILDTTEARNG